MILGGFAGVHEVNITKTYQETGDIINQQPSVVPCGSMWFHVVPCGSLPPDSHIHINTGSPHPSTTMARMRRLSFSTNNMAMIDVLIVMMAGAIAKVALRGDRENKGTKKKERRGSKAELLNEIDNKNIFQSKSFKDVEYL